MKILSALFILTLLAATTARGQFTGDGSQSTDYAYEGTTSWKLGNGNTVNTKSAYQQFNNILSDRAYVLQGYIKTFNVNSTTHGALMAAECYNASNTLLRTYHTPAIFGSTSAYWLKRDITFVPPLGTSHVRVVILLQNTAGKAYYDAVTLTQASYQQNVTNDVGHTASVATPPAGTYASVMSYGADATGATNSQDNFQAAIDANVGNTIVWVPAGTYRMDADVIMRRGTHLVLHRNAVIKRNYTGTAASGGLFKSENMTTKTSDVIIEGGTFSGNGFRGFIVGFYGSRWIVRNIHVTDYASPSSLSRAISFSGDNVYFVQNTITGPGGVNNPGGLGYGALIMAGGDVVSVIANDILAGDDAFAVAATRSSSNPFYNQDSSNVEVFHNELKSIEARMLSFGVKGADLTCICHNVRAMDCWGWAGNVGMVVFCDNSALNQAAYPAPSLVKNIVFDNIRAFGSDLNGALPLQGIKVGGDSGGWMDGLVITRCQFYNIGKEALLLKRSDATTRNNRNVTITDNILSYKSTPDNTGVQTGDEAAEIYLPIGYTNSGNTYIGPVTTHP